MNVDEGSDQNLVLQQLGGTKTESLNNEGKQKKALKQQRDTFNER